MREIIAKIGRLCESHMEKIVLAIAGIISAWLFVSGVLFSPDVVQYGNKKIPVGRIDEEISQKLDKLRTAADRVRNGTKETKYVSHLTGPVGPNDPVMAALGNRLQPKSFQALFQSPLEFLTPSTKPGQPMVALSGTGAGGARYRLPSIPRLTDVAVEYLRAAAYVPQTDVTPERPYGGTQSQVDDVDLVTVEAKLDIAGVYRQFQEFFNGSEVQRAEWRDPCLAVPKFAALQLQRQEILDTGLWSEWTAVPPNRVCPYKDLFQTVENVKDLPVGGIGIRMTRYDSLFVTTALLQPESYQIASPDERWYPPSFYDKFKRIQRQIELAEKNKERETAKNQANATAGGTTTTTGRRGDTGRGGTMTGQGGRSPMGGRGTGMTGGDMYGGTGVGGRGGRSTMGGRGGMTADGQQGGRPGTNPRGATTRGGRGANDPYQQQDGYDPRNPQSQGPSVAEVEIEFRKNQIILPTGPGMGTNLADLKDPMLIWAIDDTTQPGRMYRYRMRVGIFNPLAGSSRVAERDAARKDQVILWSDFTPVTSPVAVLKKVYFFANGVQEQTKTASIEVTRYLRGYWRAESFQVRPGETIGKEVETKKERKKPAADTTGRITNLGGRGDDPAMLDMTNMNLGLGAAQEVDDLNPAKIDFSTNVLLVDLVPVTDWTSGPDARPRTYVDLLYTEDGTRIEHMPANSKNWSKALSDAREEIGVNLRKDKKPLRPFGQTGRGMEGGRTPYGAGPYGGGGPAY
jgi:hypothetical protein